MRKNWLLIAIGLLVAVLAIGAVACDDDEDDGNGPTATAGAPVDGEPTDAEPTDEEPADGEPSTFSTVIASETDLGTILTTFDGFTVYTFDNDEAGVSNCGDDCIGTWPPLTSAGEPTAGEGVSGTLGAITRDDGTAQITYNDQPLYLYAADAAAGDTNGDGIGGIWHVVVIE